MQIPDTLPFSSVLVSDRVRAGLSGIEGLADSIFDEGLIQPLILSPTLTLLAGGRRYAALSLLISEGRLEPILYHASTSVVDRPGFLLRSEPSLIQSRSIELKENLDRQNLDWRDELRAVVQLYKLTLAEAEEQGVLVEGSLPEFLSERLNRDYGSMLQVRYQKTETALSLYTALEQNPKPYASCTSLRDAYTVHLKETSRYVAKLFASRGLTKLNELKGGRKPNLPQLPAPVAAPKIPQRTESAETISPSSPLIVLLDETPPPAVAIEIPLSSSFYLTNGLDFMEAQNPGFTNHIVCDPDYAISVDILNSHPNNRDGIMADGVAQHSVTKSLADLYRLFPLAYRALPDSGGYFIFWYALDHHEKLQAACREAGFVVQPHPLTWNKIDYTGRSNTAPNHQWPKSTEYAMVCRKGDARLTKVQTSSVYSQDAKSVTKALNHAFAKPFEVWRWIYRAIAIKGQRVFDPFVGSGSSSISAVMEGLSPIGCEIQEDNYASLMLNMRAFYRKHFGEHVTFT